MSQDYILPRAGYFVDKIESKEEFEFIKKSIHEQWSTRILSCYENICFAGELHQHSMCNYHLMADALDHSQLWPKLSRILSKETASAIDNLGFMARLRARFGQALVSDEENLGYPNYYWRLVRPNEPADVGPCHRDSWFWMLNDSYRMPPEYRHRVKVWVAVHTVVGLSGLMIEPGSQMRSDIMWTGEERDGIIKPVLKTPLQNLALSLLPLGPGEMVIFDDDLLHAGAVNTSEETRVSLEFTLLVP
jgi:hypothetical protein